MTAISLKEFQSNGFVRIGKILDAPELEAFRREELRFRGEIAGHEKTVFRSQVAHHSPVVRDFCIRGQHIPAVRQLLGDNICYWYNQFVTKFPETDLGKGQFPRHQDNGYINIEPPTTLTVWVALDDVDERNGCVWMLPESHKLGVLPHGVKSADSWHLQVPAEGDGVPIVVKAGEAVAFTGLTLHRSKNNLTAQPRRAFFMQYCLASATSRIATDPTAVARPIVESGHAWLVSGQLQWPTGA